MNAFYILHMTFYLLFMKCLQSSDVFTLKITLALDLALGC